MPKPQSTPSKTTHTPVKPKPSDAQTLAALAEIEQRRDYYHTCTNGEY
ncbi:MAG: hypothetical protein AB4426_19660 [Xenococcaceae cyanobacterium]